MNKKILDYIESLKKQLEGLPKEEVNEVVGYYEEYLSEAVDAGKDIDKVISEMDPPEKVADMLKTETSIARAERSPGLKNFANALRNAFSSVSTPMSVFLLAIVEFMTFGMIIILFGSALVSILTAAIVSFALIYEAIKIPPRFTLEIIGTIGIAMMIGGIFILLANYLYKSVKLFIRFSSGLIRLILKKSGRTAPESIKQEKNKSPKYKLAMYALLAMLTLGTMLAAVSGIPWRYFTIFNSMKQENTIKNVAFEYNPEQISKVSIVTAHSNIRIMRNSSEKIILAYEEPDWLDYEIHNNGSTLSFREKSNGRLPLFPLVMLHESRTELVVSLPRNFNPGTLSIESTGGSIFLSGLAGSIEAKTLNGSIDYSSGGVTENINIKANSRGGKIFASGIEAGQKIGEGIEYIRGNQGEKIVKLNSINGSINIDK